MSLCVSMIAITLILLPAGALATRASSLDDLDRVGGAREDAAAHSSGNDGLACDPTWPVQVMFDVDDTFMASGGGIINLKGCDADYSSHVVYPGVAQFFVELAVGGGAPRPKILRPAVMSARPEKLVNLGILQITGDHIIGKSLDATWPGSEGVNWDVKLEKQNVVPKHLDTTPIDNSVAIDYQVPELDHNFGLNSDGGKYGSFSVGYQSMGNNKAAKMKEVVSAIQNSELEACIVFIGDDGQGDCDPAAETMRNLTFPGTNTSVLLAAFIHRISVCTQSTKRECEQKNSGTSPIIVSSTYLDHARSALSLGLISEAGYRRVGRDVKAFAARFCIILRGSRAWSRSTEIVSDHGCLDLAQALERAESGPSLGDVAPSDSRFDAFCESCCSGPHIASYMFQGVSWACDEMFSRFDGDFFHPSGRSRRGEDRECPRRCPLSLKGHMGPSTLAT